MLHPNTTHIHAHVHNIHVHVLHVYTPVTQKAIQNTTKNDHSQRKITILGATLLCVKWHYHRSIDGGVYMKET